MNSRKRGADTQEAAWLADEDAFVLRQAYKKAQIRVKEGRAKPVDWLATTLQFVDDTRNPLDNEAPESDLDLIDPTSLLEELQHEEATELNKDLDVYISLERVETNIVKKEYWHAVRSICKDRLAELSGGARGARGAQSVSADVGKLFKSKTYNELVTLEDQINAKLRSDHAIDTEYWQSLLKGVTLYKSRAKLKMVTEQAITAQRQATREQQARSAQRAVNMLPVEPGAGSTGHASTGHPGQQQPHDPESLLKVPPFCKARPIVDEAIWLSQIATEREKIVKLGYVPRKRKTSTTTTGTSRQRSPDRDAALLRSSNIGQNDDALFAQQAAQDAGEDEEVFADEAEVPEQDAQHRAAKRRKPRYFNRVIMGYEWNKYNQTHYDHDNPPPKVVQGYKFNIFYPDLVDKSKGPTFKIIRDHGRKRGQLSARAGEEDACIIKFIAGAPYEDIAFRIIDREWDYSAKRERGFRSTFEGGVLQLHFQFRRMFYRK